jgi:hypothetical protein
MNMRKAIRPSAILVLLVIGLGTSACGKLTPTSAAMIIENSDPRTAFVHLHTSRYGIGPREEKFKAAGITEWTAVTEVAGAKAADIVLTTVGEHELKTANTNVCGDHCVDVPLGERTKVQVKQLSGSQKEMEHVVFQWELQPTPIGRMYGLQPATYEGKADFKNVAGNWILVHLEDGAPTP